MAEQRKLVGYSGTPLAKKLGIGEGSRVLAIRAPADYERLLEPLPPKVEFVARLSPSTDVVHFFTTKRAELARRCRSCVPASEPTRRSGSPGRRSRQECRPT